MARNLSVLMVCTGNICRSPTAEAVLRACLQSRGLAAEVLVDSAGVQGWHAGEPPDERSQAHAKRRGYDLSGLRARALEVADFQHFDLLVAMDRGHWREMQRRCPPALVHKLSLLPGDLEVPDPYYGTSADFERVLDLLENGCDALAEKLAARLR